MICALIMAGGAGKRFWPLSTEEHPKQLLKLFSDKTMIRETVDRILPLIPAENIYIATNALQTEAIKGELPMIAEENIIIEPDFKDTAAAIGYGSLFISQKVGDVTLVVLASDHLIKKTDAFRETLHIACEEADKSRAIITLGIKPTRPETGYGYLKCYGDAMINRPEKVEAFLEKPTLELAEGYITDPHYLWNSGMFVFKISTILKEIESHMPKHYRVLKNIKFYIDQELSGRKLADKTNLLFDDFEKVSIDYGVMEKTKNIKVIPADIDWYDIGSFSAFEDICEKDGNNNAVRDTRFDSVNCDGNVIYTENLEVRAIGLKDMIIVQSGNKLLVCNKYEVDKIKKIDNYYKIKNLLDD